MVCGLKINVYEGPNLGDLSNRASRKSTNNKWLQPQLILYGCIAALTSNLFYNWASLQALFLHFGVFSWACGDITVNDVLPGTPLCGAQVVAVDALMPAAVASMFLAALVGAFMTNYAGPNLATCFGLSLQILGWTLMPLLGHFSAGIIASSALIGAGSEFSGMALLACTLQWPYRKYLAVGFIFAFRAIGYAIAPILVYSSSGPNANFDKICDGYAAILLLCFAVVVISFPWRVHSGLETQPTINEEQPVNDSDDTECSQVSNSSASTSYSLSSGFRPSRALPSSFDRSDKIFRDSRTVGVHNGMSFVQTPTSTVLQILRQERRESLVSPVQELGKAISSKHFWLLLFITATTIVCTTFAAVSARTQLAKAVSLQQALIFPAGALSAFSLGYIAETKGGVAVLWVGTAALASQSLLSMVLPLQPAILGPLAAVLQVINLSIFLEQLPFYLMGAFPECIELITGALVATSGLLSIVVTPMCDFAAILEDFTAMNGLCLVLALSNIGPLYCLTRLKVSACTNTVSERSLKATSGSTNVTDRAASPTSS